MLISLKIFYRYYIIHPILKIVIVAITEIIFLKSSTYKQSSFIKLLTRYYITIVNIVISIGYNNFYFSYLLKMSFVIINKLVYNFIIFIIIH